MADAALERALRTMAPGSRLPAPGWEPSSGAEHLWARIARATFGQPAPSAVGLGRARVGGMQSLPASPTCLRGVAVGRGDFVRRAARTRRGKVGGPVPAGAWRDGVHGRGALGNAAVGGGIRWARRPRGCWRCWRERVDASGGGEDIPGHRAADLLVSPVRAAATRPGPRPGGPGPGPAGRLFLPELNLTPTQRERLDALSARVRDTTRELGRRLEERRSEPDLLYSRFEMDEARARRLREEIHEIQGDLLELHHSFQLDLRKILTPEQFTRLQEARMKRRGPPRRFRRGPGGREFSAPAAGAKGPEPP